MPRILVVEDDDIIRERLLKALNYEGYEVAGAENGAVALRLMDQFSPELVIADVLMPDVGWPRTTAPPGARSRGGWIRPRV